MTQIETLQAQLAQAQADIERLRVAAKKSVDKFWMMESSKDGVKQVFFDEKSLENLPCFLLSQALTPLPDGIGKAMADVVREAGILHKYYSDNGLLPPLCDETYHLHAAVQAYQKMMEGA